MSDDPGKREQKRPRRQRRKPDPSGEEAEARAVEAADLAAGEPDPAA